MSKRRRSLFGKDGEKAEEAEGPFTVPEEFGEPDLPREGTDERVKRALEDGPLEVSEKVDSSRNFIRAAVEDTGDDAWDNSVHANRRAPGSFFEEPEPEAAPVAEAKAEEVAAPIVPIDPPDFFAKSSVDNNQPIQFIDDPMDDPESPEPVSPDPEPEPVSTNEPLESVPFLDGGDSFFGGPPVPPTEEVPTAILDDVSQPSSIPSMSGGGLYQDTEPDPPQPEMDMVIGAMTPPPAARADEPPPPDLRKRLAEKAKETYSAEEEDDEGMGLPIVPLILLAGLIMAIAAVSFGLYTLASGPDLKAAEQVAISGQLTPPVPIPQAILPDVMRQGEPRDIPTEASIDPIEKAVAVEEVPVAAPAPRRRTAPASPKPAALGSKINVTSNRRVLVHLDGQPQGYSPMEIMVGPGTYTLSASLPGRPETEIVKSVDLSRGGTEKIGFMF